MKNLVKILSLAVSLSSASLFSASAAAVIIEGSYRGVVSALFADPANSLVTPVWENVALGDEVSGSFWYDTENAPQKSPSDNDLYIYTYSDEWISSSFTVGGKTYSSWDYANYNGNLSTEGIYFTSLDPATHGSSRESFYLVDIIGDGDYSADYTAILFSIQIASQELPLLSGLSLVQHFDWYDVDDPNSDALADIFIGSSRDGKQTASSAEIDVREFHIGIKKPVQVPEPSPLVLLSIAIAGLVIKARRLACN